MRNTVATITTFLLAAGIAACGGADAQRSASKQAPNPDDPFAEIEQSLTPLATQCTFNASTGLMTVVIADGETAVIARRGADSAILQNGQECDVPATASTVKKVTVTGSTGANTLVVDFTNGLFAMGTSSASSSGWNIDLAAGTDELVIKGTSGADKFTFGATALLLNTDNNKDVTYANIETFKVSLGDGDDTYTGAGSAVAGAVFPSAVTVWGGAGNDTFNQGSAATASETFYGGSGTDTVSYASRTNAVTVTIGAGANDGESGENDNVSDDVEVVTGGAGNDSLTAASGVAATLNGGAGDDTLVGDSGNDTLNGDAGDDTLQGKGGNDTLNGGDGDDTFDEESAANGGDVITGGAGTDTVDYSARTNALTVTMDGAAANDGESGENDNIKSDVENIKCGSGDDNVTGNALNNRIDGGAGNDTLNGGAGDDVFVQGAAADGDDTINGGAGSDTVDYSQRSANLSAVLDGTTASGDTGNSEADILGTDVENVWGGAGDDTLTGNSSANELVGNGGADTLNGGAGDDTLEGGAGDDTLNCGDGFDVTVGNVGTDTKNSDCEV